MKNVGESIELIKVIFMFFFYVDIEVLDENKGEFQFEQRINDELQYEKKIMIVMRGGEMVQVKFLLCLEY